MTRTPDAKPDATAALPDDRGGGDGPGGAPAQPRVTTWGTAERFATLGEIERAARERLPADVWAYLEAGSGEQWTVRANRAAFDRWQFRPQVGTGNADPDLSTTFLGEPLALPVLVAPFGLDTVFHPDGQCAVVRGAARAGTAAILSSNATLAFSAPRAEAPSAARDLQVSSLGHPDTVIALGRRARDAGFSGLVVTLDVDQSGWRDAPAEHRFAPDPVVSQGNYTPAELAARMAFRGPGWTWADIERVTSAVGLPWIAKGILAAGDARLAVEAGAASVFVSNHGGRQLDGAPAALDALPAIAVEVGGEVPVGLDGGVRRGPDVVKALALGASVVAVGRPAVWGLAADGEAGVARVLEIVRRETHAALALLGLPHVCALTRDALEPSPYAPTL